MKLPSLSQNHLAALLLLIAAIVQLALAILIDRHDLMSAGLVISSTVCLVTGVLLVVLSAPEPLDDRYISRLPVQGSISIARICANLGVQGTGHLLPPGHHGREKAMLFIPVARFEGIPMAGDSLSLDPASAGIMVEPSGAQLYREIREHRNLVIPSEMDSIMILAKEIGEEVLEMADRVVVTRTDTGITMTMKDYRLIEGCRAIQAESPRCCTMYPCPVCSLYATLFAEGLGSIVTLERCTPKGSDVTAVFMTVPDPVPQEESKRP